jgi:hypothetical protein
MSGFNFTLQGVPISEKQAAALVTRVKGLDKSDLSIELTKLFKINKVNTKQLFKEAVATRDEDLANLAFTLALDNPKRTTTSAQRRSLSNVIAPELRNVQSVITTLGTSKSSWAAGVCATLWALINTETEEGKFTVKDICESVINELYREEYINDESPLYKGFVFKATTDWSYSPRLFAVVSKKEEAYTYHEGTLYASIRQGVLWAKEHTLVNVEEGISYGRHGEQSEGPGARTQRKFYKINASQFGSEVSSEWPGMFESAVKYYSDMR